MADANQSRRTFVPRAAELRTQMVALAEINHSAEQHYNVVDRFETNGMQPRCHTLTQTMFAHQDQAMLAMLRVVPTNDLDVALLAGTTSLMAEQLDGLSGDDAKAEALVTSIREAIGSLTAWIANRSPEAVAIIEATWPDLARCISIDVRTAAARAADQVPS